MTTDDRFGRDLSAWLDEEAGHRVPNHLAEVLVHTVATRQRPWWSSLERFLPVTTTTMGGRIAGMPSTMLLLLVALLVAAGAGVAFAAGAFRPSAPPAPFGLAENGRLYVIDGATIRSFAADGTDPRDEITVDDGALNLAISPDGSRLAYQHGPDGSMVVSVRNLATGATVDIDGPYGIAAEPVGFSPDGRVLTFAGIDGDAGDGGAEHVYVVPADGSAPIATLGDSVLDPLRSAVWQPVFSPDGEWIAFMTRPRNAPDAEVVGELYAMHPDGTGLHRVAERADTAGPTWAPDPSLQRLLYVSSLGPTILDLRTGTSKAFGLGGWATWSPDGTRIAYWRDGPVVVRTEDVLAGTGQPVHVFESFTEGCPARPELTGRAVCSPVTWSPDGAQLVAADIVANAMLAAPADGTGTPILIPLREASGLDVRPAWQPIR